MRANRARRLFFIAAMLAASACSLLLNFDPEGLPCDNGRCAEGYGCVQNVCVKGGPVDACGGCATGERCGADSKHCLPNTCEFRKCGIGQYCEEFEEGPRCVDAKHPRLGTLCLDDAQCASGGPGRLCMRGAVQNNLTGTLRKGTCVEPCAAGGTCQSEGARCRTLSLGLDAGEVSLCLPDDAFHPCVNDTSCEDNDSLICTVFDHPAVGPVSLCDSALTTGAVVGEPCAATLAGRDGGSLCRNGLCVPRAPVDTQQSFCGELCDEGTCPSGSVCRPVEFALLGNTLRHVPMCLSRATLCLDCFAGPKTCGADAPSCVGTVTGPRCLAACNPDGGVGPACPPSLTCTFIDGGSYCLPTFGGCP
ncbi:MAG: hypothetical protein ACOZIN_00865 [Myxococcota bacterium]